MDGMFSGQGEEGGPYGRVEALEQQVTVPLKLRLLSLAQARLTRTHAHTSTRVHRGELVRGSGQGRGEGGQPDGEAGGDVGVATGDVEDALAVLELRDQRDDLHATITMLLARHNQWRQG